MTDDSPNPYQAPLADLSDDPSESKLAGRGARLGAVILDSIIMGLIIGPVLFVSTTFDDQTAAALLDQPTWLSVGVLVVYVAVNGYFLAMRGQTVGKMMVGIRIVSADTGEILPLWRVLVLRFLPVQLIQIVPGIGPVLWLVDTLFIFGDARRCVHDYVAGTIVIAAR